MIIIIDIIIIIAMILAIIGSIAAWINTNTILKDVSEIKKELGIKEYKIKHFIHDDDKNEGE
ncbi:hypothetical protein [Paraliobacillus sediminis]|uniref:hypothetical protein n=1 Tax=Paraliobacillus sediminis TaxID=1885916 RepID=UPI000E3D27DF|nr:hypothetical protein [Paraliobacillus sediminis]